MNTQFTGKNIDITPAMKQLIESKLETVTRHHEKIFSIHVTLHTERNTQIAEIMLHIRGTDIFAKAESEDMYKSIDEMIRKLDAQLLKHKNK